MRNSRRIQVVFRGDGSRYCSLEKNRFRLISEDCRRCMTMCWSSKQRAKPERGRRGKAAFEINRKRQTPGSCCDRSSCCRCLSVRDGAKSARVPVLEDMYMCLQLACMHTCRLGGIRPIRCSRVSSRPGTRWCWGMRRMIHCLADFW